MAPILTAYGFLVLFCLIHQVVRCRMNIPNNNGFERAALCSRQCEKPDDKPNEEDIPLYRCSCSPSCSVYQDCCFDSQHKNKTLSHDRDFVCLTVVGHDRYKAVSGCPPDQPDKFCKDGLGHLPPVTSKLTNVTYANIFCANCNEDKEDLIIWKVELKCSSESKTDAATRYIYRSGRIWSLNEADRSKTICKYYVRNNDSSFLEGLELRSCSSSRKISHCSSSWKDTSVLEICRSYEDPIYFHNTAFRNAHCALCNYLNPEYAECIPLHVRNVLKYGKVDSRVKKYCKTRGSDACILSLSDNSRGRPYAFSELLNINEKGCVPPAGHRCCQGQAFDYRSQRCRKVRRD